MQRAASFFLVNSFAYSHGLLSSFDGIGMLIPDAVKQKSGTDESVPLFCCFGMWTMLRSPGMPPMTRTWRGT